MPRKRQTSKLGKIAEEWFLKDTEPYKVLVKAAHDHHILKMSYKRKTVDHRKRIEKEKALAKAQIKKNNQKHAKFMKGVYKELKRLRQIEYRSKCNVKWASPLKEQTLRGVEPGQPKPGDWNYEKD
jgi:hypothetical protein